MTDKGVFDNFLAANPPRDGVWNWNETARIVSRRTKERAYADAWAAIPDGEYKYLKAKELTKSGAILELPWDEWKLRRVKPIGQYGVLSPVGPVNIYIPEMRANARQYIAEGEHSQALIAVYNSGAAVGAVFDDAFSDYAAQAPYGRRGAITQENARRIMEEWRQEHLPSNFEKIMRGVTITFLVVCSAMAVYQIAAAAAAGSTAGGTAGGTVGGSVATAEAGTVAGSMATVEAGAAVVEVGTVAAGTVEAGTVAATVGGTTTLAGVVATVQEVAQVAAVVGTVAGAVNGGGAQPAQVQQAQPVAKQAGGEVAALIAGAIGLFFFFL